MGFKLTTLVVIGTFAQVVVNTTSNHSASKVLDSSQIYRQAIYNVVELENHIFFCQDI
jgi:hypothetical protein